MNISSGVLRQQIAKNVLIVGNKKTYKTQLMQAIAGETEFKILVENANRYNLVLNGIPIGIRLLKDVFDSILLETPCLFLLEDISAIGERQYTFLPGAFVKAAASKLPKGCFDTAGRSPLFEDIFKKNQMLYFLSRHKFRYYKNSSASISLITETTVSGCLTRRAKSIATPIKNWSALAALRAKCLLLVHFSSKNMHGKGNIVVDFLIIMDSVKSNKGFVVFATTHLPSILDPALRRPGRFDETIMLQSPRRCCQVSGKLLRLVPPQGGSGGCKQSRIAADGPKFSPFLYFPKEILAKGVHSHSEEKTWKSSAVSAWETIAPQHGRCPFLEINFSMARCKQDAWFRPRSFPSAWNKKALCPRQIPVMPGLVFSATVRGCFLHASVRGY
jgi:hypothetical protein